MSAALAAPAAASAATRGSADPRDDAQALLRAALGAHGWNAAAFEFARARASDRGEDDDPLHNRLGGTAGVLGEPVAWPLGYDSDADGALVPLVRVRTDTGAVHCDPPPPEEVDDGTAARWVRAAGAVEVLARGDAAVLAAAAPAVVARLCHAAAARGRAVDGAAPGVLARRAADAYAAVAEEPMWEAARRLEALRCRRRLVGDDEAVAVGVAAAWLAERLAERVPHRVAVIAEAVEAAAAWGAAGAAAAAAARAQRLAAVAEDAAVAARLAELAAVEEPAGAAVARG